MRSRTRPTSDPRAVALLVWEAAVAVHGRHPAARRLLEALEAVPSDVVAGAVADAVADARARARSNGWTDDDLRELETRRLRPSPPGPVVGVRHLALLLGLPPLPAVTPAEATPAGDAAMLAKIRALLAKAESTTFPEEAEALTTKAQELMARHRVDGAAVDGRAGVTHGGPSGRRIWVDDPYGGPKADLLAVVALANRCRAVQLAGLGCTHVVGFPGDLAVVELLHTSLLVQATTAMAAAGAQTDGRGRSRTRSFRHSFLLSFAARVGHRLRAANETGEAAALADQGERAAEVLPVLARRERDVDTALEAAFPHLRTRRARATNAAGWAAGRLAADRADLSVGDALPSRRSG